MKYFIIVLAIRNVKTESKHKRDKSNICLSFISFAGCRIFTKRYRINQIYKYTQMCNLLEVVHSNVRYDYI